MDDFPAALARALDRHLDGFDHLESVERLSGGASQETYRLVAVINGEPTTLALRRAAGGEEDPVDDRRPGLALEAALMRAARAAGVPEPMVHAVFDGDDEVGAGFVMEWLDGETLGARINRSPELADVRARLAHECGRVLATIHGIDVDAAGLAPHLHTVTTEQFVTEMWDGYIELDTPQPMIDFTARWLLDHLPPEGPPRLVHNDFRNGNLMVGPDGIRAVLDWEVAHIGDPMRDLGWICTNSWRFGNHDLPVGGFGTYRDLFAGYESVAGTPVDPDHVRFWEIFGSFWWAIGCLRMGEHYRTGPDPTVERPGIARRSSECQVDCVNLLIPGPVELVTETVEAGRRSITDLPTVDELVTSVRDFLRSEVMSATSGRTSFLARVASNSLDIVARELALGPAHRAAERDRLAALLAADGDLLDLRWELTRGLRSGRIDLDRPGLAAHLRATVVNQVAIDQPTYSGFRVATGR